MRNNPFSEAKRVISQFFETEYWYRFRKRLGDYDRNVSTLNDTWNGHNTLLKWQIMKIEHMYINLRKYGCEAMCYVDSPDFLDNCEAPDMFYALKYVQDRAKETSELQWYGGKYYYTYDKESSKPWMIFDKKVVDVIPANKIPKNKRFYRVDFDDDGNFKGHTPCDKEVYENIQIASFDTWEEMSTWINNCKDEPDVDNFDRNAIMYANSIHFETTELHNLSPRLRNVVRGQRRKLHDLYEYRKLLKQLDTLDYTYSEPWHSRSDDIWKKYKDDDKKRIEEYEKLWKEFKAYRRSLLDKIADLWNERADFWWD